jgi:hypothetical protein
MKYIFTLLIVLFVKFKASAIFDVEWRENTLCNGEIHYNSESSEKMEYHIDNTNLNVSHLKFWYFYKGCTIGEMEEDSLGNRYFVGNEISRKLELFREREYWQLFLKNNNLNPFIIRWHNDSWSMFPKQNDDGGLGLILHIFILIRILVAVTIIGIILMKIQGKKTFKFVEFFFWSISIFYFLRWLLGEFPQSI